jgi:hypothetical protein
LPNCNKASQIFRLSAAFMPSLREPLRVLSRLKSQLQNAHKLLIINVNILSGERQDGQICIWATLGARFYSLHRTTLKPALGLG